LWQALDKLMDNYVIQWVNAKNQEHLALTEAGKLAAAAVDLEDLS
jgi:hypothetical protein